jgi:hypothetical protein
VVISRICSPLRPAMSDLPECLWVRSYSGTGWASRRPYFPAICTSRKVQDRRSFIGGSDARIIMGQDEKALVRLWQEKRGEIGPEDLSTNLIVQLGLATNVIPARTYSAGSSTRSSAGWRPPSTASWNRPGR